MPDEGRENRTGGSVGRLVVDWAGEVNPRRLIWGQRRLVEGPFT